MTAPRDKFGRPIVVVTGMGVVTSLGAGKADNWAKLTAGESGIRTITRFPTDGLKTHDGRNGRFRAGRAFFLDRPVRAAGRYRDRRSRRPVRNRQQRRFSRTAFPRRRPGRGRMAATAGAWTRDRQNAISTMTISAGQRRRKIHPLSPPFPVRFGGRSSGREIRHQGFADFTFDRLRFGRHRDPARRRSHPPRRGGRGALRRDRWFGQPGSTGPVLAAFGAVDP